MIRRRRWAIESEELVEVSQRQLQRELLDLRERMGKAGSFGAKCSADVQLCFEGISAIGRRTFQSI